MSELLPDVPAAERAAILLLTVGEEEAARILQHLDQREVQKLSEAMSSLHRVSTEHISAVIDAFLETVSDETGLTMGAGRYLKNTLTHALGENKANSVIEKMNGGSTAALDKLRWMDPRSIADFIATEHPQIQAIVMSFLEPDQAAAVIGFIEDVEMRKTILMRVATLESIPPGAIDELAQVLDERAEPSGGARFATLGGKRSAAEIINNMEKSSNEQVLEAIREADEDLGEAINELMFIFDNLMLIDDRGIQTLLKEVSTDALTMALKGADPALQEKVFANMSKRAAELLRDDMDAKGPVRLSEVEVAQKEILVQVKKLSDEGEIVLGGAGGEAMV